jgi:hypothetical protein
MKRGGLPANRIQKECRVSCMTAWSRHSLDMGISDKIVTSLVLGNAGAGADF